MGDEIGALNDHGYLDDPAHAADNRWVHRPRMPWPAPPDPHGIYAGLRHLVEVRSSLPQLHAAVPTEVWDPRDPGVLLVVRRHESTPLLAAFNVTAEARPVARDVLQWLGLDPTRLVDHLTGTAPITYDGEVVLPAYGAVWLTAT